MAPVCLVTGASPGGIGWEMAYDMACRGMTTVIVCRNVDKGNKARAIIQEQSGSDDVHLMIADLSSFQSIQRLADEFRSRFSSLHVLINNAGHISSTYELSSERIEKTFAVNALAPLLLTYLLFNTLKQSAPARIINVSSSGHVYAPGIAFWNLHGEHPHLYHGGLAYSQSKLALNILTFELARRFQRLGLTVNCFCPGIVDTTMAQPLTRSINLLLGPILSSRIVQSPSDGAQTGVYLATAPEVSRTTGEYFQFGKAIRASPIAYSQPLTERLWRESKRMISRYYKITE